jgi:glycine betaine/proline transport system ATP-binding protein
MERPRPVVAESAGPRTALRTMRDAQAAAAYVVDRDRRLVGTVEDRDAIKLLRRGESSLAGIIKHDAVTVDEDAVLMDLFVPAVESKLPVAVTNAAGRLLGVIPRVTLLAALGPGPGATEEITLPHPPVPTTVIDELLAETAAQADKIEEVR